MAAASWLATMLDHEMLELARRVPIAPRSTTDRALETSPKWNKSGAQVAAELGGRYLLRYLLRDQVGLYRDGSEDQHFVTPTPYTAGETVSWLALPAPHEERPFVMVLDPSKIDDELWGPRWVRLGKGIEYILPNGFPKQAVVLGWEQQVS